MKTSANATDICVWCSQQRQRHCQLQRCLVSENKHTGFICHVACASVRYSIRPIMMSITQSANTTEDRQHDHRMRDTSRPRTIATQTNIMCIMYI